ncbi:hypothetical protein GCM10022239_19180 [Leifsonia bigeumensis]|uniref:Uncharacterized protein n=1 Tax=Leifsonella bigeumensis TaxID=433643 RepID=A0ABP7FNY4_9MICO
MSTDTKTTARALAAGDEIHVLAGGLLIFGLALKRGDTLTVTQRQIDGQTDTVGNNWTRDLSDEAQLERWREIRLGFGPFPDDLRRWLYGSPQWAVEREAARQRAWAIIDPVERAAAREAVEIEYGPGLPTSRTLNAAPAAQQRPSGNRGR